MRRKPQQSLSRRRDDPLLFELAVPPEERLFYIWWSRADDGRAYWTRRGNVPTDRFETIGQQRGNRDGALADHVDADLMKEVDRRAQPVDPVRVQRAGLEATPAGHERRAGVDELSLALDVRPAGLQHRELLARFRRHVEDRRSLRTAHPFVSVGGEKIDLRFLHVDRQ